MDGARKRACDRRTLAAWMVLAGVCLCAIGVSAQEPAAVPDKPAEKSKISPDHPLVPALKLANESRAAAEKVEDYTCNFYKRELIGGQMIPQTMQMKLRHKPFSVYLKYQNPHPGREVLFVEGANGNKLLAHEEGFKGLAGTLALPPTGPDAMQETRYPLTQIGIRNMLDTVIAQWELEGQFGEVDVKYYPQAKIGELACKAIETSHPTPRKQFKFHKTRLYLDRETSLPVALEQYAWPPQPGGQPLLVEFYNYLQLKTNVGLRDMDFDPRNPAYRF